MKVKIPLAVVLLLSAAVGYLLGTEAGRQQRDMILVKVGRKPELAPEGEGEGDAAPEAEADADAEAEADADA